MRQYIKHIITVSFFLSCFSTPFAQTMQTLSYTTRDGLPSNSIYKVVLDNKGFLWVSTENGLSRFDGMNFKNYSTADGLPDNDIITLLIDSNQVIWAIPFLKRPAYYNPEKDRFENSETDPELRKIELGNTNNASALEYGGMAFYNNKRELFIYKNKKITAYKNIITALRTGVIERTIEYSSGEYIIVCSDSLRIFKQGTVSSSSPFEKYNFISEYFDHSFYVAHKNQLSKYAVSNNGLVTIQVEKALPFSIRLMSKTGKRLMVTSMNGSTYTIDTVNMELKEPILYDVSVRSALEDKDGNVWVSTSNKGLIKIQQKRISAYNAVSLLQQGFNAITFNKKLFAGNFYGELLVYDGLRGLKIISLGAEKRFEGIIRQVVEMKNGIYVAAQLGSFLIDKNDFHIIRKFENIPNPSSKAAKALNDSILLLGNHTQAYLYNVVTGRFIDSTLKRVSALGIGNDKKIYVGSNDGLYRWDKDSLYYFGKEYKTLRYRVNCIASSPDSLLWVGLGSDSLLVLKKDRLISSVALGDIIPGNVCKSLFCNKAGETWLGTNKGLNKISYRYNGSNLSFINTFFSTADGLTGEQVNDITMYNDTLYFATDGGINYMPANLQLPVTDIATYITGILINQKSVLVTGSYSLPYYKNNIHIEFSGVDLTGHHPLFEYSINNGPWLRTDKNSIDLRLSSGKYAIDIRAIKRDGNPSSKIASLLIKIQTPFWENGYFWLLVGVILFILTFLVLKKRNNLKQKASLEKIVAEKKLAEMEMQALKAQINPHFVFNCLNSIKAFIFDKDFLQAGKYLDTFSELLRNTLNNSASALISLQEEINYLDNYLQLEKLRFDDKFDYTIQAHESLDRKTTYVPSMLLQPYVENALRHGIRHLENKKGELKIIITKKNNFITCIIDDNGVGRKKAGELKNNLHTEYQSKGMELSGKRAKLYNIKEEIIDKEDAAGNSLGTTIILTYH